VQARNVFEEGIATVMTVRDFTQIFDAYAQFEESLVARRMVRGCGVFVLVCVRESEKERKRERERERERVCVCVCGVCGVCVCVCVCVCMSV
jgi:hypothetical protein